MIYIRYDTIASSNKTLVRNLSYKLYMAFVELKSGQVFTNTL